MALNFNGTSVEIPANRLPDGYAKPTVTKFDDAQNVDNFTYTIDKATVHNATETTTVDNIVTNLSVQISAQLSTNYDNTANTVDAFAELQHIRTNMVLDEDLYTNGATDYICVVTVNVKVS